MKLKRAHLKETVLKTLNHYPVTMIVGPRQCGKTTIAREICKQLEGVYYDLEDPTTALQPEIAKLVLESHTGLIVIDECQEQPDLLKLIRVLADREPLPARFLILGSASLELVKQGSETLAGRVGYIMMNGFDLTEIGKASYQQLWQRGQFPDSFLANSDHMSYQWRQDFITTFLERDIPKLGINLPSPSLRRFWAMLSHYHGQLLNISELSRSLGVKETTTRHYLDILTGCFMVRQLQPWYENIGKRLIKSPKIYIKDTGLLHTLLTVETRDQLLSHPKVGASFEGFIIEQVIQCTESQQNSYFYRTHGGAELDLLIMKGGKKYGVECKLADTPSTSKSIHQSLQDLNLDHLFIIYPGERRYPLGQKITAVPIAQIASLI